MNPDVDAVVCRVLAIAAGTGVATVTAETCVADLGIDSVYAMAMTTLLEMELGISIPLDEVIRLLAMERVRDITAALTGLVPCSERAGP